MLCGAFACCQNDWTAGLQRGEKTVPEENNMLLQTRMSGWVYVLSTLRQTEAAFHF